MFEVNFELNNQPIEHPANLDDLEIELNFDKDSPEARVGLTKWRLVQQDAKRIEDYINGGLTGGVGIFEGIPFTMQLTQDNVSRFFFFYLDLTDGAVFSCDDSTLVAKESRKIDWFNDRIDGFTFDYLFEVGIIKKTDFVPVPYVISVIPDYRESIIALIGIFVISQEIRGAVQKISEMIAASANPFSAPSEVIKLILFVIYFVTVIIALIKLVDDLISLLIQPIKYHMGMYAKTLLERGLQFLGLTLDSSLFNDSDFKDLFILPAKYATPRDANDNRIFGFLTPDPNVQKGVPDGTFGDFLRSLKEFFNAKIIIDAGVCKFERVDFEPNPAAYIIPDVEQRFFTTNADEINSTYFIEFATDINDKNTIDEYKGTTVQVNTVPQTIDNVNNLTLRGSRIVNIPFAHGRRKEVLTPIETILKNALGVISAIFNGFIIVVNGVITLANAIGDAIDKLKRVLNLIGINLNINIPNIPTIPVVNFANIVNDRVGMLKLENDFINVPKMFILRKGATDRDNKLDANNTDIMSAKNLWNKFHNINGFASASGHTPNQWKRKNIENVPFCFDDFLLVKDNAKILDSEGREAKIESLKWNVDNRVANIQYRYKETYTTNLTEQLIERDGR